MPARDDLDLKGLSHAEYELLQQLNLVSMWLARHEETHVQVLCREELDQTEAEAIAIIQKAKDYMALGAVESAADAKAQYRMRLEGIYALCMAHAVGNDVEVTQKPIKVKVVVHDDPASEGKEAGTQVINGQVVKTKPDVLNVGAVGLAIKAAREIAHVMGARPSVARGVNIGKMQMLVQGNQGQALPGADILDQLGNADLAAAAGVQLALEALPEPAGAEASHAGNGES